MNNRLVLVICMIFSLSLACSLFYAPIPTATIAVPPSGTPVPASTATETPLPAATLTPTLEPPSVTGQFLNDVRVVSHDSFDNTGNWNLWDPKTGRLANNVLQLQGTSSWASGLVFNQKFQGGSGIVLKFKLQNANAKSQFVFDAGQWQTDAFRQFGINNGKTPKADLSQGQQDLGGKYLHGNLSLQTDTWYNILMAIDPNARLLAVMWDPSDESRLSVFDQDFSQKWAGQNWDFIVQADAGETVYVSDFYQISFGTMK